MPKILKMFKMVQGLRVVDGKKPITLSISKTDVKRGAKKDSGHCAAALACKRQLGATEVKIHLSRVFMRVGNRWVRYITPRSLRTEIISFDRGGDFEPGKYTLNPPPEHDRLTGTRQGGRDKKRRAYKIHRVTGVRAEYRA